MLRRCALISWCSCLLIACGGGGDDDDDDTVDDDVCSATPPVCGAPEHFSCTEVPGAPPRCEPRTPCPLSGWGRSCAVDAECCSGFCAPSGRCESPSGQLIPVFDLPYGNALALGDRHVVVAYMESDGLPDPSPEFHVVVVEIDREGSTVGTPATFEYPMVSPGQSHNFQFLAPLGPEHFLMVTIDPDFERRMHLFRRDGLTVTELSVTDTTHGYHGGHPVDDTRYLLRYRETSVSDSAVTYRMVIRDGDEIREGPPLVRPAPTEFPGLDPDEPQTGAPLLRVGPDTFREIRGGYVHPPGFLAAWTLTVNADDSLTASDPVVFEGSETRTMEPIVTGNGTGDAVVAYLSYEQGWRYGFLRDGATVYEEGGPLFDDEASYREAAEDSAWAYFDGRYYLRGWWGVLYRFDELGAPPIEMPLDLGTGACRDTAPVMRLGDLAVMLVCDGGSPLHLRVMDL